MYVACAFVLFLIFFNFYFLVFFSFCTLFQLPGTCSDKLCASQRIFFSYADPFVFFMFANSVICFVLLLLLVWFVDVATAAYVSQVNASPFSKSSPV